MRTVLIGTLLLSLASPTLGQTIYKSVDENGNVSYSDRPPEGGRSESAETLPPVNTLPEQKPTRSYPNSAREETDDEATIDYTLSLASPAPESSVPPGQRDLPIVLNAEPRTRSRLCVLHGWRAAGGNPFQPICGRGNFPRRPSNSRNDRR